MHDLIGAILLLAWALCWIVGGWWMVRAAFKLQPEEEGVIGLVVGLAAEVGLANFIARVIPLPWAAWLSACLVLLLGFILALRQGGLAMLKIKIIPVQWLAFIAITYGFFLISRGLAIYDDYAHLPTLSIMAAGAIPPHFALNPEISYGYHYFLLLFGAEIMRLSGSMPWTAWDFARSFTIAPAVILGGLWAYRVTRNRLAGLLGNAGVLFFSGTRWLFLLIPDSILSKLSSQVHLIGAGAASGPTLVSSLANPWPVDGQGTFPLPFAFENGLLSSGAEAVHRSSGLMIVAVLFVLLLTSTRCRNRWAVPVSIILISSLALLTEIEIFLMFLAIPLLVFARMIRSRSRKLPKPLLMWLVIWFTSGLIIAVQGGAWTVTMGTILAAIQGHVAPISYPTTGLILVAPSIVSIQMGILSLLDIRSVIIALGEIGPVLLVFPLLVAWGWKAARAERWFEATLICAAVLSLAMIFVHYSGSVGNTSRLYFYIPVCALMAVSLGWLWASHRGRFIRYATGALCAVAMFGGVIMLGVQLPNIKYHQFSFFLSSYDAIMAETYWNKLEPDALVFDSIPYRATTIFGRYTKTGSSWYEYSPEFLELRALPDVYKIRRAGFSYAYIDKSYWLDLTLEQQNAFEKSCAVLLQEVSQTWIQ